MNSHGITNPNKGHSENESEDAHLDRIVKQKFHRALYEEDIGLENLLTKSVLCVQDYHTFNTFLRKLEEEEKISVYESLIIMESYLVKFKKLISMLDGENLYKVKRELAEKHRIKMQKNKLDEFLEYE